MYRNLKQHVIKKHSVYFKSLRIMLIQAAGVWFILLFPVFPKVFKIDQSLNKYIIYHSEVCQSSQERK